jgi:Leucine-rich repeat (LRR) protein
VHEICKNLWQKIGQATTTSYATEVIFVAAKQNGNIEEALQSVRNLEQIIREISDAWEASLTLTSGGEKLFTPQYQAIRNIFKRNPDVQPSEIEYEIRGGVVVKLNIGSMDFGDITSLEGLYNIEDLSLDFPKIKNLEPVARMKNLKSLRVTNSSGLIDISALAGLRHLERVDFSASGLNSILALAEIPTLRSVTLDDCRSLKDFSPLENLTELISLAATDSHIKPRVLARLNKLRNLDIRQAEISPEDIPELTKNLSLMTDMMILQMKNIPCADFSFVEKMPRLAGLDACYTKATDLSVLTNNTTLMNIGISGLKLPNYDFLDNKPKLVNITAYDNVQMRGRGFREALIKKLGGKVVIQA